MLAFVAAEARAGRPQALHVYSHLQAWTQGNADINPANDADAPYARAAVACWCLAAEAGYVPSMVALSEALRKGWGCSQDVETAALWCSRAVARTHTLPAAPGAAPDPEASESVLYNAMDRQLLKVGPGPLAERAEMENGEAIWDQIEWARQFRHIAQRARGPQAFVQSCVRGDDSSVQRMVLQAVAFGETYLNCGPDRAGSAAAGYAPALGTHGVPAPVVGLRAACRLGHLAVVKSLLGDRLPSTLELEGIRSLEHAYRTACACDGGLDGQVEKHLQLLLRTNDSPLRIAAGSYNYGLNVAFRAACAGGHLPVVEYLLDLSLSTGSDWHIDSSTWVEAAKAARSRAGYTNVWWYMKARARKDNLDFYIASDDESGDSDDNSVEV